jgi:hypothetical protein
MPHLSAVAEIAELPSRAFGPLLDALEALHGPVEWLEVYPDNGSEAVIFTPVEPPPDGSVMGWAVESVDGETWQGVDLARTGVILATASCCFECAAWLALALIEESVNAGL